MLDNEIIKKDNLSLTQKESYFKLNFGGEKHTTNVVVFSFLILNPIGNIIENKLYSLKKSDFNRLNDNFNFYIRKEREQFLIDFYVSLPKYSFARFVSFYKQFNHYIIKFLKTKGIIICATNKEKSIFTATRIVPTKILREYEQYNFNKNVFDFTELFSEVCGYRILNLESMENSVKLIRYLKLGYNPRVHRYHWILGINNFSGINDYVIKNGAIKDKNITITRLNSYELQISIHSGKNKNLSNIELFNSGIEQMRERLKLIDNISIVEIISLEGLLYYKKAIVEIGFPILEPKTIREIRKHFVINKRYKIYGLTYWIDTSIGLELDIQFSINKNDLAKILSLMDNFRVLRELIKYPNIIKTLRDNEIIGIIPFNITASNPEITRFRNDFANIEKAIYEIKDLSILVKVLIIDTS